MEPLEIGNVTIYPFGIVLALALGACVIWSLVRCAGPRMRKTQEIFWLIAIPLGLVLAHLGYALCNLDMIEDEFVEVLQDFTGGGYLLYGALAGAAIALAVACRITGERMGRAADLLAGPFLLLGAACVLGEGLIGAGYGWKVEDWFSTENNMSLLATDEPGALTAFFSRFPFAVKEPYYGYQNWAVFLPIILLLLGGCLYACRMAMRWEGSRAVFSLSWYAAVRIFYESLRQDDIPKWGFVRVNQILSAVLLFILLLLCWRRAGKGLGVSLALFVGGVLLAGGMEFALEQKIGFLEWMTMDLCYLVSAIGCGLFFHSVNRLRRMN